MNTIIKFADDTAAVGLITDKSEKVYLKEVEGLTRWCQDNNLLLDVSKNNDNGLWEEWGNHQQVLGGEEVPWCPHQRGPDLGPAL